MRVHSVSGVFVKTKVFAFKYANYKSSYNLLKNKALCKCCENGSFLCCSLRRKGEAITV